MFKKIIMVSAILQGSSLMAVPCEPSPLGEELFLRGGFNGWGETHELCYQGENQYEVVLEVSTLESKHFKIATSDWLTLSCTIDSGYPSEDIEVLLSEEAAMPIKLGEQMALTCYNEDDRVAQGLSPIFNGLKYDFQLDASYAFKLNLDPETLEASLILSEQ